MTNLKTFPQFPQDFPKDGFSLTFFREKILRKREGWWSHIRCPDIARAPELRLHLSLNDVEEDAELSLSIQGAYPNFGKEIRDRVQ